LVQAATRGAGNGQTSAFLVSGNPAIAYGDGSGLGYVRSTDSVGVAWGSSVTVNGSATLTVPAARPSLIMASSQPAIAYFDGVAQTTKYVRSLDTTGAAWGGSVNVANNGIWCSMKIVNGNPAVASIHNGTEQLQFTRSTNATGSSWGSTVSIDATSESGCSLEVVSGIPAITYTESGTGNLMYVRATNANGTSWGTPVTVSSTGVSSEPHMIIANGNPAIAYRGDASSADDFTYVRATDSTGTAWGTPLVISTERAQSSSLINVNGNPAATALFSGGASVGYVKANNSSGTSWASKEDADSGTSGHTGSVDLGGGSFGISFAPSTKVMYKRVI
jgi:hypothetical protein